LVRAIAIVAPLAALLATRVVFTALVAEHELRYFPDSRDFLEAASERPSGKQFFYPKPIVVPAIYRALGVDVLAIQSFQQELAFWSWWIFGLSVYACVRRPLARALALVATIGLVLAPLRIGWTSVLLSESISDSLLALLLATGVGLGWVATCLAPSRRRTAACTAFALLFAIVAAAWAFTRDSNALSLIAAVATAAVVFWKPLIRSRGTRGLLDDAWAPLLALLVLAIAIAALGTSTTNPGPSTRRVFRAGWYALARPRSVYPMTNNVLHRILPDPRAAAFFRERGMPWPPGIEEYTGQMANYRRHRFFVDRKFRPVVRWIHAHGTPTYSLWLIRHPLERAEEVIDARWVVLGVGDLRRYMPNGWIETIDGAPLLEPLRQASRSRILLLAALLLAPFWIVRAGHGAVRDVAVCTLAGSLVGTTAAYYGDAMEEMRHCWGAAQGVVVALAMLAVAWLDTTRAR
jgi:hypothetical protein